MEVGGCREIEMGSKPFSLCGRAQNGQLARSFGLQAAPGQVQGY